MWKSSCSLVHLVPSVARRSSATVAPSMRCRKSARTRSISLRMSLVSTGPPGEGAQVSRLGRLGDWSICPAPSRTASPPPPPASCHPRRSTGSGAHRFGVYVHVPFCTVRCGYCDFNTYTLTELGGRLRAGASLGTYASATLARARPRRRGSSATGCRPVETVFVGGGTPTLLPAADLAAVLARHTRPVRARARRGGDHRGQPRLGLGRVARELAAGGFTRVSFGMQSAVPHVLRDPRPDPRPGQRRPRRRLGPGRRDSTSASTSSTARRGSPWTTGGAASTPRSRLEPDHVSAYALVVEEGTRLAAPGAPRRGAGARGRRRGRQVRAGRRGARRRGLRLVRGEQLGAVAGAPVPAQRGRTGPAATGGASGRAPTATSAACAGGTSSTPRRMRRGSPRGSRRPPVARCSPTSSATTSGCCSAPGLTRGIPVSGLAAGGPGARWPASWPTGWSTGRSAVRDRQVRAHPARAPARRHGRAPAPRVSGGTGARR